MRGRCFTQDVWQDVVRLTDGRVRDRGQYIDADSAEAARAWPPALAGERVEVIRVPHGSVWPRKNPVISAATFDAWLGRGCG